MEIVEEWELLMAPAALETMGVGEERLIPTDEDVGDDLDEIEEVEVAERLLDDEDEDIDEEEAPIILPRLDEDPVLLIKLLPLIGGTDFPTYMGVGAAELRGGKCTRGATGGWMCSKGAETSYVKTQHRRKVLV